MGDMNFTEEDKQKVIDMLNMVAKCAEFTFKTEDVINYYRLLAHIQTKVLPKIDANILEVKRVVDTSKEPPKEAAKEPKTKAKNP